MIKHRKSFLNNIAERLNRDRLTKVEKPGWTVQLEQNIYDGLSSEALIEMLETQCEKIHTTFERVDKENLQQCLSSIFTKVGAQLIIMPRDGRTVRLGLSNFFSKLKDQDFKVGVWGEMEAKQAIKFAEQADIGLAYSDITLAESGTVTLFHDEDHGRVLTVLPKIFICIIEKSTIVPRLTEAAGIVQDRLNTTEKKPSCISFISGPSNSADIELNLIVGVHGPVEAYYIVVD